MVGSPDGGRPGTGDTRPVPHERSRRFTMNIPLIITFVFVGAVLAFVAYALIRPFTHTDHDHRDVFHPPHLD
jgi:hypothetical protein